MTVQSGEKGKEVKNIKSRDNLRINIYSYDENSVLEGNLKVEEY